MGRLVSGKDIKSIWARTPFPIESAIFAMKLSGTGRSEPGMTQTMWQHAVLAQASIFSKKSVVHPNCVETYSVTDCNYSFFSQVGKML